MSSRHQAYAWRALQEAGVKTIIDLREKDKTERLPALCEEYDMRYFHYPVDTSAEAIVQMVELFPQFCQLIDAGDFYIACAMGLHRTDIALNAYWLFHAAEHGYDQPLKDYKAACLDAASKGTVMVSPFISRDEQEVLHALLHDNRYIIYLSDNGFGNYFKPSDLLFDAVAAGRLLILSPWTHNPDKRTITRAECVALNQMAEEISAR